MEIGDKVLCVNDRFRSSWVKTLHVDQRPNVGEVYKVRGFTYDQGGILLEEINNDRAMCNEGFLEPAFLKHRFIKWNPEEYEEEILKKEEVKI